MSLFDSLFTGLIIGVILSIPAIVSEVIRPEGNMPLLMDVETFWGRKLSEGQVIFWSTVVHLGMSTLYGGLVPLLMLQGVVSPLLPLWNLLAYSVGFNIFIGAVALPVVGFGFFGRKEGGFVWLELLATHLLYGVLFWILGKAFYL